MADDTAPIFKDVLDNMRKASEAGLKMQQEVMNQWTSLWPGFPSPQAAWLNQVRDFQHQWSAAISDLATKHRETMDQQYQAALESLEEALRLGESANPEEYRDRAEQLCRKTLDCMRECSELQIKEFQDAMNKWTELATKAGD